MLTYEEPNTYRINNRKDFDPQIKLDSKCIKKCFDFADDMTFKQLGEHRDHRTGGGRRRKRLRFLRILFRGKLLNLVSINFVQRRMQRYLNQICLY